MELLFFNNLDLWAKTNNIVRLELTVECCNNTAKNLYEKNGFKIEGIRKKYNSLLLVPLLMSFIWQKFYKINFQLHYLQSN